MGSSVASPAHAPPIRPAAKPRMSRRKGPGQRRVTRKRDISPLFDDRGHPHPQDEWESLLPEVKAGRLIRKRRHEAPKLDEMDPNFGEEYDEAKHG